MEVVYDFCPTRRIDGTGNPYLINRVRCVDSVIEAWLWCFPPPSPREVSVSCEYMS